MNPNEISHRLSNSTSVALYRVTSCRVEADALSDAAITGNSPEDTVISGAIACMF